MERGDPVREVGKRGQLFFFFSLPSFLGKLKKLERPAHPEKTKHGDELANVL